MDPLVLVVHLAQHLLKESLAQLALLDLSLLVVLVALSTLNRLLAPLDPPDLNRLLAHSLPVAPVVPLARNRLLDLNSLLALVVPLAPLTHSVLRPLKECVVPLALPALTAQMVLLDLHHQLALHMVVATAMKVAMVAAMVATVASATVVDTVERMVSATAAAMVTTSGEFYEKNDTLCQSPTICTNNSIKKTQLTTILLFNQIYQIIKS